MINFYSYQDDGNKYLAPHFQVHEFRCKDGADSIIIDSELVLVLEAIRTHFGKAVHINSAYRTDAHNKKKEVGGERKSQHLYGKAADIWIEGVTPKELYNFCDKMLIAGGVGLYSSIVHVDVRPVKSRWVG